MILDSFQWLLTFNVELSVLLASIIALRWLLKKTVNLYNLYWLWLLLPLVPLAGFIATSIPVSQQALVAEQLNSLQANYGISLFSPATTNSNGAVNSQFVSILEPDKTPISFMQILASLWLLGSAFFLIRLLQQHRVLRQQLLTAAVPLDLKTNYPIVGVDVDEFSPAVYGFFKPTIYFPKALYERLGDEQRSLILEHEEQHIRQGHLWLNLLWDICACINWFNPLMYVARHFFRHDQEVHCDSLVLKSHDKRRQQAYGNALLTTVSATHSVSLLCSWKMFDQLEERIMNIKNKYPKTKFAILATTIASALALSSLYAIALADEAGKGDGKTLKKLNVIDLSADHDASEQEKAANSVSIFNIDGNGEKQIVMKLNGKTYRMEHGERFVEQDGERRALTESESNEMNDLLDKAERYRNADGKDRRDIFEQENVYAYSYDTDQEANTSEWVNEIIESLARERLKANEMRTKITSLINQANIDGVELANEIIDNVYQQSLKAGEPEVRIKNALARAKASNDPVLRTAIRSLEKAQEQLEKSRELVQKNQKKALEKLQELEQISPIGEEAKKG